MALRIKSIRGTRDVVPADSHKWQYVERVAMEVAAGYGMQELRVPTIEKTELFQRSVGETTDVVQKEMYTFDKGKESITLRPEITAGIVRAVLENNLLADTQPVKVATVLSCFRHENPQSGRLREFHQFDIEIFGSASPTTDAEAIGVAHDFFMRLGLTEYRLEINSIGCPECRPQYNQLLVDYFRARYDELCPTCKERLEKNPLRLLDCKEERCQLIAKDAPLIVDHLCGACQEHFDGLKVRLNALDMPFIVNPKIVRGLDYYSRTVFEFISEHAGAQGTICGGGRYDGLVEYMGGPSTPGIGFGLGLERLLMVMEAEGCPFPEPKKCDLYIGSMGEAENVKALSLTAGLRREGFTVLCDVMNRSVKAQMKYANKLGAAYSCILGEQELADGKVAVRNMDTGETADVALEVAALKDYLYGQLTGGIAGGDHLIEGVLGQLLEDQ